MKEHDFSDILEGRMTDTKEEILAQILDHENRAKEYDQYLENHKKIRTGWKRAISTELFDISKRMKNLFYRKIKIPIESVERSSIPSTLSIRLRIINSDVFASFSDIIYEGDLRFLQVKFGGICFEGGQCYVALQDTENMFLGRISLEDFYEKVVPLIQVEEK